MSRLFRLNVMLPKTEHNEREKEPLSKKVVHTSLLKRILLATGSVASMIFGTFLIVFAVLDWEFGSVPIGWLAIVPVRAFTTGELEDLFYIVVGIGFWILGVFGLSKSLKK